MSIVSVGIFQLLRDGTYMFNFATARLSLTGESRITMLAIKKLIQQSQGSTIAISRINANEPANSYIEAIMAEEAVVSTTQSNCGCANGGASLVTIGATGAPVQLFQKNGYLLSVYPQVLPGTDLTNSTQVQANTYYKTITLSANVDSLMFAFVDSKEGTAIAVGARFKKWIYKNKPPVIVFMRENIVVKRMHSAGFYYN